MASKDPDHGEATPRTAAPSQHVPFEEALTRAARVAAAAERPKKRPAAKPASGPAAAGRAPPVQPKPAPAPAPPPPSTGRAPPPPPTPAPENRAGETARDPTPLVAAAVMIVAVATVGFALWPRDRPDPVPTTAAVAPAPKPVTAPRVARETPRMQVTRTAPDRVAVVVEDTAPAGQREILHTVQPGDTLWAIAGHYIRDPWAYRELAARSGIANPDQIRPGDQVRIVFIDPVPTREPSP